MLSLAVAPLLIAGAFAAVPIAYGSPPAYGAPAFYGTPPANSAPTAYSSAAPTAYSSTAATSSAASPASTFPATDGTERHFGLYVKKVGNTTVELGEFNGDSINNLPATAYTGSQSGAYWCDMPIIFSSKYNPYSSNPSVYDITPTSNVTGAPLEIRADSRAFWSTDYLRIVSAADADEQGRRAVTQSYCDGETGTPGVSVSTGILTYEGNNFGSFYVCWIENNIFGPTLFYRSASQAVPADCADVILVPSW